ncbi:unannotated protein [freshwater metagenome]|uniref:Unannotated protein n=1 Tax=freshwater metagenome TaxID=449393 RepID=A0A6J7I213_9ZZZZ|nr:hypothetical protein [Actinomycetota bacterium]
MGDPVRAAREAKLAGWPGRLICLGRSGSHQVCVYAIDVKPGINALLGRQHVTST